MITDSQLRPYQHRALEAAHAQLAAGVRRLLIVAPTGSGKTKFAAHLAREANRAGRRVLWLAHRRELVEQATERLEAEGLFVGALGATQVETIQGLLASGQRPPATLVVVDEAHHLLADEWGRLAAHYAEATVVGLTATPERGDGRPMGDAFDAIQVVASIGELTSQGFLVPCEVYSASGPRERMAEAPVAAYQRLAAGRKAVFFGRDVDHARALALELQAAGIAAECIDGDLTAEERKRRLDAYRAGELQALTNVFILTEGWDAPETEVCVLARSMSTTSMYLQCIGRALRPAPGKSRALLIDLFGSVYRHGLPDEERIYSLEGKSAIRRAKRLSLRTCQQCGATFLSVPVCPRCGFATPHRELPSAETGNVARVQSVPTRAEKAAYLAKLRFVARRRGLSQHWVAAQFFRKWKHPIHSNWTPSTPKETSYVP